MWSNGTIGIRKKLRKYVTVKYWCKHFEEPSKSRIENGRIFKLTLKQGDTEVYNSDRELDIEPQKEEAEQSRKALCLVYI